MHNYDMAFNGATSRSYNIFFYDYPEFTYAQDRQESISISGRNGDIFTGDKSYGNLEINCTFGILATTQREWDLALRACKKWLRGKVDNKLIFSYNEDYYYLVKKVVVQNHTRELGRFGTISVTFYCYPCEYVIGGDSFQDIRGSLYNAHGESHPTYYIEGEGVCTLIVNDNKVTANVGQNLTINTELQIAYRQDGTENNTAITGDYENLYLMPGSNTIGITSGFQLKVAPMWSELI